jgi:hypothetical protein
MPRSTGKSSGSRPKIMPLSEVEALAVLPAPLVFAWRPALPCARCPLISLPVALPPGATVPIVIRDRRIRNAELFG